jgi:hypothetical protein
LGDDIKKVTHALGIDKAVEVVADALGIDDCGCDKRQETLNKLFPRNKNVEWLTDEEYSFLKSLVGKRGWKFEERKQLTNIYNLTFNKTNKVTSCGSCLTDMVRQLAPLVTAYEQEDE